MMERVQLRAPFWNRDSRLDSFPRSDIIGHGNLEGKTPTRFINILTLLQSCLYLVSLARLGQSDKEFNVHRLQSVPTVSPERTLRISITRDAQVAQRGPSERSQVALGDRYRFVVTSANFARRKNETMAQAAVRLERKQLGSLDFFLAPWEYELCTCIMYRLVDIHASRSCALHAGHHLRRKRRAPAASRRKQH